MSIEAGMRRVHRVIAAVFLLAMIPAAVVSAQGDAESPFVYGPLPFLFALIITGTYLLVMPWVRRMRRRGSARASTEANL